MSERTKKILIVSVIVLAAAAVVWLLWMLFFRKPPPPAPSVPSLAVPTVPGVLPPAGLRPPVAPGIEAPAEAPVAPIAPAPSSVAQGGETAVASLTEEEAFRPIITSNGAVYYYAPSQGKFFEKLPDKKVSELAPAFFPQVKEINWDASGQKAILEFPDNSKVFYDFSARRQISLPAHWHDFSFSPDGSQIVFKTDHPNPDKRWLIAASPDGSQVRAIEPLGENGRYVTPLWSPSNDVAALFTKAVQFSRQEVYFLGFNQENYKTMLVEGFGFKPKWSPQGDRLLYSIYPNDEQSKPQLWIVDARGEEIGKNRKYLRVETWADKCVFGSDNLTVYCAVPRELPRGAGAYPELAAGVADDFYKIDSATGIRTLLAIPAPRAVHAEDISLSSDQSRLVFKDGFSGKVMEIKLK